MAKSVIEKEFKILNEKGVDAILTKYVNRIELLYPDSKLNISNVIHSNIHSSFEDITYKLRVYRTLNEHVDMIPRMSSITKNKLFKGDKYIGKHEVEKMISPSEFFNLFEMYGNRGDDMVAYTLIKDRYYFSIPYKKKKAKVTIDHCRLASDYPLIYNVLIDNPKIEELFNVGIKSIEYIEIESLNQSFNDSSFKEFMLNEFRRCAIDEDIVVSNAGIKKLIDGMKNE